MEFFYFRSIPVHRIMQCFFPRRTRVEEKKKKTRTVNDLLRESCLSSSRHSSSNLRVPGDDMTVDVHILSARQRRVPALDGIQTMMGGSRNI